MPRLVDELGVTTVDDRVNHDDEDGSADAFE